MSYCKYCGTPLPGHQRYCDNYCKTKARMNDPRYKDKPKARTPPSKDKFHAFVKAQKQAAKQGKRLSYGEWQSQKYIK